MNIRKLRKGKSLVGRKLGIDGMITGIVGRYDGELEAPVTNIILLKGGVLMGRYDCGDDRPTIVYKAPGGCWTTKQIVRRLMRPAGRIRAGQRPLTVVTH